MLLEIATTSGALTGAISGRPDQCTMALPHFSEPSLLIPLSAMFRKRRQIHADNSTPIPWPTVSTSTAQYFDQAINQTVVYRVSHTRVGLALMYVAGVVSGMLGIGSGSLKVPRWTLRWAFPSRSPPPPATSMIGVTAAASAGVYFARGDIDPFVAAPVATGVLIGATAGSRLLPRLHSHFIRIPSSSCCSGFQPDVVEGSQVAMNDSIQNPKIQNPKSLDLLISTLLRIGVTLSLAIVVLERC